MRGFMGLAVVEQGKEDEWLETVDEHEESDCEDGLDQVGDSTTEAKDDGNEDPVQGTLPILSIGAFARCVLYPADNE